MGLPAVLTRVPGSRCASGKRQTVTARPRAEVPRAGSLPEVGWGPLCGSRVLLRVQKGCAGDICTSSRGISSAVVNAHVCVREGSGHMAFCLCVLDHHTEAALGGGARHRWQV